MAEEVDRQMVQEEDLEQILNGQFTERDDKDGGKSCTDLSFASDLLNRRDSLMNKSIKTRSINRRCETHRDDQQSVNQDSNTI